MRVHCHLCGATLRRPHEFARLRRADTDDEIFVCTDEHRCDVRIAFNPVTGARSPDDEAPVVGIRGDRAFRRPASRS
jgi:hypothetical protein